MKLHHLILVGFFSLVFVSCNLNGKSERTPFINLRAMHIVGSDTTFLSFTNTTLDTISVGDTILFQTLLGSNDLGYLQECEITSSRAKSVEFIWDSKDSLDAVFTSASDYDKGLFVMPGTFRLLFFPFQYVAKEAEEDLTLTFMVQTTGSQDYNKNALTIRTPIKERE